MAHLPIHLRLPVAAARGGHPMTCDFLASAWGRFWTSSATGARGR